MGDAGVIRVRCFALTRRLPPCDLPQNSVYGFDGVVPGGLMVRGCVARRPVQVRRLPIVMLARTKKGRKNVRIGNSFLSTYWKRGVEEGEGH